MPNTINYLKKATFKGKPFYSKEELNTGILAFCKTSSLGLNLYKSVFSLLVHTLIKRGLSTIVGGSLLTGVYEYFIEFQGLGKLYAALPSFIKDWMLKGLNFAGNQVASNIAANISESVVYRSETNEIGKIAANIVETKEIKELNPSNERMENVIENSTTSNVIETIATTAAAAGGASVIETAIHEGKWYNLSASGSCVILGLGVVVYAFGFGVIPPLAIGGITYKVCTFGLASIGITGFKAACVSTGVTLLTVSSTAFLKKRSAEVDTNKNNIIDED